MWLVTPFLPLVYPDSRLDGVSDVEVDVDGPPAEAFADASKEVVTVGATTILVVAATPLPIPVVIVR